MRVRSVAILFTLVTGCASQQVVDRFARVQPGMTRDEVVSLLGEPSSRWNLDRASHGLDGEWLQWGDGLSSLASSAIYHTRPERAYAVDFDTEGLVVAKSSPSWVDRDAEVDPE